MKLSISNHLVFTVDFQKQVYFGIETFLYLIYMFGTKTWILQTIHIICSEIKLP